ncbi:hypothetical protein ACFE04_012827 [Oxalis oulophora]
MARLIRTIISSSSLSSMMHSLNSCSPFLQSQGATSALRQFATTTTTKSPFEANVLRIIRNEIDYQSEYAPPHEPATTFGSFTVKDRPGEQWMTMKGKFGDKEDIKLEATMFDGCVSVPRVGEDKSGFDLRLHISVLVDISKGDDGNDLEFVCSAWPDRLEIQKVYILRRDKMTTMPYLGPDYRRMNVELQKTLRDFLEMRGINNQLSFFLHEYMANKDRIELIHWLGKVESYVQK